MARVDRLAPWLAGAALALPIVWTRYPPMGDLPMHEALVALMSHARDPRWNPVGIYEVVAPQANQLFHFLAGLLALVLPSDKACILVVAATVLLTPVACARWLAELGRSSAPSLLVGPIACGWMFRWGLAANMLGFALVLAFMPLLERLGRRVTKRRAAEATLGAVLVFFAHESAALVFALAAMQLALVRGGPAKRVLARSLPAATLLVLALAQWRLGSQLAGANMQNIAFDAGTGPVARLLALPESVFGAYDATRLFVLAAPTMVALVAFVLASRAARHRSIPLRAAIHRHRHAVLSALLLVGFLFFPMSLGGTTALAYRFLPFAVAFAVVAASPCVGRSGRGSRTSDVALGLAALAPMAMLVVERPAFDAADARYRALDAVIAHIPHGTAVAQLDLTPNQPSSASVVPGAPSRVLAERGGRMLFQLTDMPPNPVYVRPSARWDEPILRIRHAPFAFSPSYDGARFEYVLVLVRGHWPRYRADVARAFAPEAELVTTSGEWDLFRSTIRVDAIDAPDRPLPDPPPENLADRINRIRQRASTDR